MRAATSGARSCGPGSSGCGSRRSIATPTRSACGEADIARVVDFSDPEAVLEAVADVELDGVLTVSADRAVPVVAAVAEARGLPGIGVETAHLMTHKVAMRRRLAEAGVPQPRFAALRTLSERLRAVDEVGFPAVLKPADSGGQRGVFRVESLDDVEAHLHEALAASPTGEAILEQFVDGTEMNGIVIARGGEPIVLTLSDRLRPPGVGFGVGWIHRLPGDGLRRPARRVGARRGAHRARARARDRDRLPAADRGAGRPRRGGRVRGAHPGRPDGRPRPPRGRRRPGRGAAPHRARRGAAGRARAAALPPAARDPLPDRRSRPASTGAGRAGGLAGEGARVPRRRRGRHVPGRGRDDPAGAARRRPARLRDRHGRTRTAEALERAEAAARLVEVEVEEAE